MRKRENNGELRKRKQWGIERERTMGNRERENNGELREREQWGIEREKTMGN